MGATRDAHVLACRRTALPTILFFLRQAKLCEHAIDELLHQVVDALRCVIKCGHGGHDGGAGVMDSQHIFEMNPIERSFAQAQDERAALFQAHVRGASKKIVGNTRSDGAQGTG